MNFRLNKDLIVFNKIEEVVRLELIQFNVFKYLTLFLLYLVEHQRIELCGALAKWVTATSVSIAV